jgi:hypothetical protein
LAQCLDCVRIDGIEAPRARRPISDKAGAFEHTQVLGNRGPTHGKFAREFPDGHRAAHEALQNGAARRIAEGIELSALLGQNTPDEQQVMAQLDKVLNVEREIKRAQLGLMVRLKGKLTPDQQAHLRQLRGKPAGN